MHPCPEVRSTPAGLVRIVGINAGLDLYLPPESAREFARMLRIEARRAEMLPPAPPGSTTRRPSSA